MYGSEGGVNLAAWRQRVFLVPTDHDRIGFHFLQYRRHASAIGIHLNRRPGIGFRSAREPGVLGLDPNEVRIATREALPIASSRVVAPASRYHSGE